MRILISNDDGILSPGLAALYAAVADMGEIHVVAPDSPQSAAGHSITLKHPLVIQPVQVFSPQPFTGSSVNGRPADCVFAAGILVTLAAFWWSRRRRSVAPGRRLSVS